VSGRGANHGQPHKMTPLLVLALCRALFALPDFPRVGPYWRALRALRVAALRRLPNVRVGRNVSISRGFYFWSRLELDIGEDCVIKEHVRLGVGTTHIDRPYFRCGPRTVILAHANIDCSGGVEVGSDTHVGRNCLVFSHTHDISSKTVRVLDAPETCAPVRIGDDVMIFSDVVILQGVTVGTGAVLAVRSVVTRDVPPYTIVAGTPAKPIGART
jgi:acetyltransferase-like isoleucine patch superfamily enzyme